MNAAAQTFAMRPIAAIHADPQVRTKMNPIALRELAASVAQDGIIEPIIVRQWDDTPEGFIIIAGHRRYEAAKLAGLHEVPTILRDVSEEGAQQLQLIENIQREDLDLADTAAALRLLADQYGTAKEVAAILHKSKSWISKRLALTSKRFSADVRALLDEKVCEDVEMLTMLNTIANHRDGATTLPRLLNAVRAGKAGRAHAQAALDKLKEAKEADDGGEGEEDSGGEPQSFSFTLNDEEWAKLEALGGAKWIKRQLKKATV